MKPTNEQITAAARALSNDNADVCNVNREDNWNIYGDSFRETARVALEAAMGGAPTVEQVIANEELAADLLRMIEKLDMIPQYADLVRRAVSELTRSNA